MVLTRSQELFEESKKVLVGGVNSPVRAMKPYPFFVKKAEGCRLVDEDDHSYIDYCLGYGPLILGHANPIVMDAVKSQLDNGTLYGTPTELEIRFAEKVIRHVPSAEMVRFVNTGTEATMGAIRLARGVTKKSKIIKFEGAFHGAHDYVLVKAGSGATTHGVPDSAGIPAETTENTILAPFNDESAVEDIVKKEGDDLACIILEPIIGNSGCVLPKKGYLQFLRKITAENNILLIFDEVITGFRLGLGGAQQHFGVTPDITTLGKILGGGLPIGCIASTREIMENMAPLGPIYQAGTFNGNPLSAVAGLAALSELERSGVYTLLARSGEKMRSGLADITSDIGVEARIYGACSMYQMYFTDGDVVDYTTALKADKDLFLAYQRELLKRGVFLPPSQYECNFLSTAHTPEDLDFTLEAMDAALRKVA
ncbi:glutamate-1-semialdehyde 2,1-aminomutase [archaeon BMS3Bbin16]|nr:glutamate-1-semialdehyde 2,1-aminomutase [archaeon BMS3Bbin16]